MKKSINAGSCENIKGSKDQIRNDDVNFYSIETKELERRWPIALKEITELVKRIKDIRAANPKPLPQAISDLDKTHFIEMLARSIIEDNRPDLKFSVARRMANKIGEYLLWRRETSIPVIHELIVLLPWWTSQIPGEVIPRIRDIGLYYVLNGLVVPIQTVWKDLLESRMVFIGHCACRSSGVVDDLYHDGKIFNLLDAKEGKRLLDRFFDRYECLKDSQGNIPDTDPHFLELFKAMDYIRKNNPSHYDMALFLKKTYPSWELLPVHPKYTQTWIRGLHKNRKAHMLHKELALELATILYLTRGTIFNSMKLIDTPYTICSCPSPETGGGCTLTHWYYFDQSNVSLLPNETFYGIRKDQNQNPLPCRYFPIRSRRDCIGCGCQHDRKHPRSVDIVLAQADDFLNRYGGKDDKQDNPA